MFFQATSGSQAAADAQSKLNEAKSTVTLLQAEVKKLVDPLENIKESFSALMIGSEGLNKLFIGNRSRIQETMTVMSELIPMITELGGSLEDSQKILAEVAAGSRRNVIATKEDATSLFAVGKLIGDSVGNIVDNFAKVGVQYQGISEGVKNSIDYIQTVGANASAVMKDVNQNVSQLSRYNFQDGVVGLTKMAAQASLLRFDMGETFKLADDVLDPDRAIEVASAFQRLGVNAGNLVDPFQLMNQSINDPSGLQDSLINIGKQFTYFDEKTKTFKINPQGILTLREVSKQTGLSAEKLREAALSAADFDQRLAAVGRSKISINASEEDQKLLANMARMGKGGSYEVMVKDPDKGMIAKKLEELNEDQFKSLIEEQKKRPKTIEEMQKNQLDISELSLAQLRTINANIGLAITGGPTTISQMSKFMNQGVREFATQTGKNTNEAIKKITKESGDFIKKIQEAKTEKEREDLISQLSKSTLEITKNLGGEILGNVTSALSTVPLFKKGMDPLTDLLKGANLVAAKEKNTDTQLGSKTNATTTTSAINTDIFRNQTKQQEQILRSQTTASAVAKSPEKLDVSGKIIIEVMGRDLELTGPVTKALQNASTSLEEKIYSMVEKQAKVKGIQLGGKS